MKLRAILGSALSLWAVLCACEAHAQSQKFMWRFYRPGNTGIQGDYCDALWLEPNGDPWIGGYDPSFEEGGLAKFVQAENRWINVSNVDFREIGHAANTGTTRCRDIEPDSHGNLWMGTGRGVLRYKPSQGPGSLKHYTANNSPLPGGWMTNVEVTPDDRVWASGYATVWGGGGLSRFDPTTNQWTLLGTNRSEVLASQPKPGGGGYYLWACPGEGSGGPVDRYDSTTQAWTRLPATPGQPRNLPGGHCRDSAGNLWIYRILADGFSAQLDCRRPDGSWIGVPPPPVAGIDAFRAKTPNLVLLADGGGNVWRFNGVTWSSLGSRGAGGFSMDVDMDQQGNVWACGTGGAAKRDAVTGVWQRYRVTNSSQFDSFNRDLALGPNGEMYATANAGPGAGGLVRFDGLRWTGFNNLHYGLGLPWPFPTDNSSAVTVRSTGRVVVNPMFNGVHEFDGTAWRDLFAGRTDIASLVEDSQGRLWALGDYYYLAYLDGQTWTEVPVISWGLKLSQDPQRPGTVWASTLHEVTRTDGTYRFSRTIDDFAELTAQSDTFGGAAPAPDGIVWIGCTVMLGAGGEGGGLIRLDADTGQYSILTYENGWPFPGKYVFPHCVTPDGKVWMTYVNTHQYFDGGLCWYDGKRVGVFPGPVDGAFQWGGLPHTQVSDVQVKLVPGGYELWMTCLSRGIAVLRVQTPTPISPKS